MRWDGQLVDKADIAVGDTVYVCPSYSSRGRDDLSVLYQAPVVKVGRTRVYVQLHGRVRPFHLDTGYECADPAQVKIYTPARHAYEAERREILRELDVRSIPWRLLSNEQLRAVAEIVRQATGGD